MRQRIVPRRFVEHGLCGRQEQQKDEENQQAHSAVVRFAQPLGFVENQRDAQVVSKEEDQREQECKDEVPQRKLIKNSEHVCAKEHGGKNQHLRA